MMLVRLGLACLAFALVTSRTPDEWRDKVIYQVLTDRFAQNPQYADSSSNCDLKSYCGGTWAGLVSRLDYIQGLGVDAIWITPVVENTDGGYHGYWLKDLFNLNSNFGSASDLANMVAEAHKRGIWVMVDVVANHVGPVGSDFTQIAPFNETSHYHPECEITDWNNQPQVEQCRLSGLPDLDQNNAFVRTTLKTWIGNLTQHFDIDGVRVDTVPEIHPDFWNEFNAAAGTYCLGEVFNGNIDYVAGYQNHMDGIFSYPLFFTMRSVFQNKGTPMSNIEALLGPSGTIWAKFKDPGLLGNFIDNHDNARFLNAQGDVHMYMNALAVTLTTTGIPVIYYGTEQLFHGGNDPENRETLWPNYSNTTDMYSFLAKVIQHRKSVALYKEPQVQRYAASNFYAFTRGDTLVAVTNQGTGSTVNYTLTYLPETWKAGDNVCDILTGDCIQVTSGGLAIGLQDGLPKIFYPKRA